MAATDPRPPESAQGDPRPGGPPDLPAGDEPLTADLARRPPRLSTRVLTAIVLVLVVLLVASVVVAVVVLHQPRLTPVPVPSVSSIA